MMVHIWITLLLLSFIAGLIGILATGDARWLFALVPPIAIFLLAVKNGM